MQPWHKNSIQL